MKKYMQPSTVIMKSMLILMAGESIHTHTEVGNGQQLGNETHFDDTEDINPQTDKSFWDDAE